MINNIEDIKNIFQQHIDNFVKEFSISLIYVFGSFARGANRKDSDIDIAVLLNGEIDVYTKVMFESRTMSEYMDKEHFRRTQQKYSHMKFLEIMNGK